MEKAMMGSDRKYTRSLESIAEVEEEDSMQGPHSAIEQTLSMKEDNQAPTEVGKSKGLLSARKRHMEKHLVHKSVMLTPVERKTMDAGCWNKRLPFRDLSFDVLTKQRQLLDDTAIAVLPLKGNKINQDTSLDVESASANTQSSTWASAEPGSLAGASADTSDIVLSKAVSDKLTTSFNTNLENVREEWGVEDTIIKIMYMIKEGTKPITVKELLSRGPATSKRTRLHAARCFMSVLNLKERGFIRVIKCPSTLEIVDIELGPKFDNVK